MYLVGNWIVDSALRVPERFLQGKSEQVQSGQVKAEQVKSGQDVS